MNKILKIACISLLPIVGFSYELNFSKEFKETINPDLLTTNISISIENKDENKINKDIEVFNNFIKNTKLVEIKRGSYSLNPKYKYYKDRQEFIGYSGYLNYSVESKMAKPLNQVINKIIDLKESKQSVKLNISNITWEISDVKESKSFDNLRLEAIKWVNTYSSTLSKKLHTKCNVKAININGYNPPIRSYSNGMALTKSSRMAYDVSPVKKEQDISINPYFSLECK